MIVAEVEHATVTLDDRAPAPAPLLAEVPEGEHRARVAADGYLPTDMRLTAVAGRLVTAEARLVERPARVEVSGPHGAQLVVDAQLVGSLPHDALQLPAGPHVVALLERGREPWLQRLSLARGATVKLSGQLVPTRRRRLGRGLMVAAGVGAGLSLVFGVVWIQAEVAAGGLLDQKRGLTPGESAAYKDDVDRRNQFRVVSIVSLSLTGALALTGGALLYFDNPSLDAAR